MMKPVPESGACFGRAMVLEHVLHKCDKYWLYTANDEGKVVIVKKYRKVQEEVCWLFHATRLSFRYLLTFGRNS